MVRQHEQQKQGNTVRRYEVTEADLPLHCPMPGTAAWSSHPRVFLDVMQEGQARCPYCSAEYTLKE